VRAVPRGSNGVEFAMILVLYYFAVGVHKVISDEREVYRSRSKKKCESILDIESLFGVWTR
jgi:hypothetical protein